MTGFEKAFDFVLTAAIVLPLAVLAQLIFGWLIFGFPVAILRWLQSCFAQK